MEISFVEFTLVEIALVEITLVKELIPGDPFTGMNSSFNPGNRFAGSCFGDLNNFHITAFMSLT